MRKILFYIALLFFGAETPFLFSMQQPNDGDEVPVVAVAAPNKKISLSQLEEEIVKQTIFENFDRIIVCMKKSLCEFKEKSIEKRIPQATLFSEFYKHVKNYLVSAVEADFVLYVKRFIENLNFFRLKVFNDTFLMSEIPSLKDDFGREDLLLEGLSCEDKNGITTQFKTLLAYAFHCKAAKIVQFCINNRMNKNVRVTDLEIFCCIGMMDKSECLNFPSLCKDFFQVSCMTDPSFLQTIKMNKDLFVHAMKNGSPMHSKQLLAAVFMPYVKLTTDDMAIIFPDLVKKKRFDLTLLETIALEQRKNPLLNAYLLQEEKYDLVRFEDGTTPLTFAVRSGLFSFIEKLCKQCYPDAKTQVSLLVAVVNNHDYLACEALLVNCSGLAKGLNENYESLLRLIHGLPNNCILDEIEVLILSYVDEDKLPVCRADFLQRVREKRAQRESNQRKTTKPQGSAAASSGPAAASSGPSQEQQLTEALNQLCLGEQVARGGIYQDQSKELVRLEEMPERLSILQEEQANFMILDFFPKEVRARALINNQHDQFVAAVNQQPVDRLKLLSDAKLEKIDMELAEGDARALLEIKHKEVRARDLVREEVKQSQLVIAKDFLVISEQIGRSDLEVQEDNLRMAVNKALSSAKKKDIFAKKQARRAELKRKAAALEEEFSYLKPEEDAVAHVVTVHSEPSPAKRENGELEICLTPRKTTKSKLKLIPEEGNKLELAPRDKAHLERMVSIDDSLELVEPSLCDESESCMRPPCVTQLFSLHARVEEYLAFNVRQDIEDSRERVSGTMPDVDQMDHGYTLSLFKNILLNGSTFLCRPHDNVHGESRLAFIAKATMQDARGKRDGFATLVFAKDNTCVHYCFTRQHPGDVKFKSDNGQLYPAYVLKPVQAFGRIKEGQLMFELPSA